MPRKTRKPYQPIPGDPSTYRSLSAKAFKKALLGETVMSTLPDGTKDQAHAEDNCQCCIQ